VDKKGRARCLAFSLLVQVWFKACVLRDRIRRLACAVPRTPCNVGFPMIGSIGPGFVPGRSFYVLER